MTTMLRNAGLVLIAVVVCASSASAADPVAQCQRAIVKASSQFAQARMKALQKCDEGVLKGSLPGPCPDPTAAAAITKATDKIYRAIGKRCGGADHVCGLDTTDELTPGAVGWPSTCPNFEHGTCENAITDCGGIAECLVCIAGAAGDQAIDLAYGDLAPNGGDQTLLGCQRSIGKASAAFLAAKTKALQKCWDGRLAGKHANSCVPPAVGDDKYLAAIAKAETKLRTTVCKACGGGDESCDGVDDLAPAAIGFASTCPPLTLPVPGGAACGGPIADLGGIVDCLACVTEFKADCTDQLGVPELVPTYPAECSDGCPEEAPTGPCPTSMSFTTEGSGADLDIGFTGLGHDGILPTNGRLTLSVSGCAGATHPTCGQCDVSGPIDNPGGAAFDTHRCRDASWVSCATDGDCTSAGATGPCVYFLGPPLSQPVGGLGFCLQNEVAGTIAGTLDVEDGSLNAGLSLRASVYVTGVPSAPCPRCVAGTCESGPRAGFPCAIQGSGLFGDVSLDCPPNPAGIGGTRTVAMTLSTGGQTRTLSAASPTCRQTGFTGLKCLCDTCNDVNGDGCFTNADCPMSGGSPGICGGRRCIGGSEMGKPCNVCLGGSNQGATCANATACPGGTCSVGCAGGGQCNRPGEPTQPNNCAGAICLEVGNHEGICPDLSDNLCSIERFRGCTISADCNPPPVGGCADCLPNQTCEVVNRPCFTDSGLIGGSVTVEGRADEPCGSTARPKIGALFCVPPYATGFVNAPYGLPGLGRALVPGTVTVSP